MTECVARQFIGKTGRDDDYGSHQPFVPNICSPSVAVVPPDRSFTSWPLGGEAWGRAHRIVRPARTGRQGEWRSSVPHPAISGSSVIAALAAMARRLRSFSTA